MKKLISFLFAISMAVASFAQYPLPDTQVLGNLYVPNDSVGIGTSSPNENLDVQGTFIAKDGDSAQFKLGLTTLPFFGGMIDVLFHGAVARKTFGDWHYLTTASSNSVANGLSTEISAVNHTNGTIRNVVADSLNAYIQSGNLTTPNENSIIIVNDSSINLVLRSSGHRYLSIINHQTEVVRVDSTNTLSYFHGNPSNGDVLTSDANGAASWQAPPTAAVKQDTGTVTTGTDWETLGAYTLASDLDNFTSLDLDFALTTLGGKDDSLLVTFDTDTLLFTACVDTVGYVNRTTLFRAESSNYHFSNSSDFSNGGFSEDNPSNVLTIKAKSQTAGNNNLRYFRITYFE
jgi:hypothetical protein